MDQFTQFLTTIPFWLQAPIVFVVVVPLCAVLAVVWLRAIDFLGAFVLRQSAKLEALKDTVEE
ncbi:hypothetical protein P4N68_10075 [Corynebacterium felinum]|uniref:Uncharacterized protein n=1 Tax=Corynebacterium felinum TaxID=131318 RepID=A0ABU2B4F4_9CORY|nr:MULTISPECIES: hypothetical protein [Corynebacterium]MDF5821418.1 hypothetical protein [Corynebacterium felinum]MDO4762025.1 hypothetical protein [Corynebacterium sp.]MDR7353492.1 hypothetical protein [Corynebacterium felinum]WJY95671.1 hypothetical protein CFELI_10365 [Corynebacterium felinum]